MKQRLLLALLVLFAAAGMVKAADEVKVTPTGATDVTITFTGGTPNVTPTTGVTVSGQKITIEKTVTSEVNISCVSSTGVTFSGQMASLTIDNSTIAAVSFSNGSKVGNFTITSSATSLTTLNCSNLGLTALDISGASGITSLTLTGNKLIPSITYNATGRTVTWGTQTLSATAPTPTPRSTGVDILTAYNTQLSYLANHLSGEYSFAWEKQKDDKTGYTSTNEVHKILTNVGSYAFYDDNRYYTSGIYKCTVTRNGVSVALENIVISPALITIKVLKSPKNGWNEPMGSIIHSKTFSGIEVKDCQQSDKLSHKALPSATDDNQDITSYQCHQGDRIQVTGTALEHYKFSKFITNDGLVGDQPLAGATVTTYEVKAKCAKDNPSVQEEVTIQAVFEGELHTINFTETALNGKFQITDVTNNNTAISDGAQVPYGHKLRITATPDERFYSKYMISGLDPNDENIKAPAKDKNTSNANFKTQNVADIYVDNNRSIAVQFISNIIENTTTYNLRLVPPTGISKWSEVISAIKINDQGVTTIPSNNLDDIKFDKLSATETDKNIPVVIEVTDAKYRIKSIQLGTQPLTITSEGNKKFTTTFRAPEDGNAAFTITIIELKEITVNYEKDASSKAVQQVYSYDKKAKEFKYTTDPYGLKLDVEYKKSGASDDAYTTVAPVNEGNYTVRYKRNADEIYKAIATTSLEVTPITGIEKGDVIRILPADVAITTAPTVTAVKQNDGTYKYVVSGGVAKALGETITNTGKFEVIEETGLTAGNPTAKQIADATVMTNVPSGTTTSHTVTVRFQVKTETTVNSNYTPVITTVPVKIGNDPVTTYAVTLHPDLVTVDGVPAKDVKVTTEIYNGATKIDGKNIPVNTYIKLRAIVDGYSKAEFVNSKPGSSDRPEAKLMSGNIYETDPIKVTSPLDYTIALTGKLKQVYTIEAKQQTPTYSGEAKPYNISTGDLVIKKNGATIVAGSQTLAGFLALHPIYYKDEAGNIMEGAPVNAGKYSVCIDIPADPVNGYASQTLIATNALQVLKKDPAVTWPTSVSTIGKGLKLSAALFKGETADIAGTFAWEDGNIIPQAGQRYTIVFTPALEFIKNYEVLKLTADEQNTQSEYENLAISVSTLPIISIANVANGQIVVKSGKTEYHAGNPVNDKTVLTITAVPNNGFECKSLTVDEAGTEHAISSGGTFTIDGKSIYITAEFELKSTFDPNTQYTVTLPKADAVKGIIINKPGVNAVKKDGSFSFTFGSLAADAKNIVVKVDGTTLAPVDGKYTIAKVDGNKVVTVTLSNPTKIKVSVEKETKNPKGYVMGKVEVEGLAKDSTCYYGDEVTLVAFPESGVTFTGWSGAITGTDKLATFTVKQSMTIKPKFTGVPTGIETIQDTRIYGREGHIFIGCDGEAKVTLISMDGRVKKVEISGDTRIEMAAGIYGVVVEKGSDRMQTKVIVR